MKSRNRLACVAGLALASWTACAVSPVVIEVGEGESLADVQQKVRTALATAPQGVEVVLGPGEYEIPDGLAFGAEDGGKSPSAPVVWRAKHPGLTRLVGARKIPLKSFAPVKDPEVLARLPEEGRGKVYVSDVSSFLPGALPEFPKTFYAVPPAPMVFIGESFGRLARWPNAGWATFSNVVDRGVFVGSESNPVYRNGAFVFPEPRAKRWDLSKGVWLHGPFTWEWFVCAAKVGSLGTENGTNDVLRFDSTFSFGVVAKTWSRKFGTFYAFNVFEELDSPGEWWLDRERKLLYLVPLNGAPSAADDIRIAANAQALVRGTGLRNAVFRDINFAYSYSDLVNLEQAENVRFERCRFACAASNAMTVKGDGNVISGCEMRHVGASGVYLDGGDRPSLRRSGSVLENCRIHDVSVLKRTGTVGLELHGCGMTVRGNEIYDAPAQGIWYYGNEHLFESNDIHHVLLETADAGAIYTGRDWTSQGNVLRHNYVHDLGNPKQRGHTYAFYFDDCDSGDEMYGNVVRNAHQGVLLGGGRDIRIHHNVFADCENGLSVDNRGMKQSTNATLNLIRKAERLRYREEPWKSRYPHLANILDEAPGEPRYDTIGTNVFVNCSKAVVVMKDTPEMNGVIPKIAFAGNLVFTAKGAKPAKMDARVAQAFTEYPAGTDAGFVDAAAGDFRLKAGSPAAEALTGFAPVTCGAAPRESLLFLAAHADDSEGFAATAKLLSRTYDVHLVDLCHGLYELGEAGVTDDPRLPGRMREEQAACAYLGITPHFLSEPDADAHGTRLSVDQLTEILRKVKPRAVFTHWPLDRHADHVQCAAILARALVKAGRAPKPGQPYDDTMCERYFFEVMFGQTKHFHPTYSVDVTETIHDKFGMLRRYVQQNIRDSIVIDNERRARRRGEERTPPCPYADLFSTYDGKPIPGGVLDKLPQAVLSRPGEGGR